MTINAYYVVWTELLIHRTVQYFFCLTVDVKILLNFHCMKQRSFGNSSLLWESKQWVVLRAVCSRKRQNQGQRPRGRNTHGESQSSKRPAWRGVLSRRWGQEEKQIWMMYDLTGQSKEFNCVVSLTRNVGQFWGEEWYVTGFALSNERLAVGWRTVYGKLIYESRTHWLRACSEAWINLRPIFATLFSWSLCLLSVRKTLDVVEMMKCAHRAEKFGMFATWCIAFWRWSPLPEVYELTTEKKEQEHFITLRRNGEGQALEGALWGQCRLSGWLQQCESAFLMTGAGPPWPRCPVWWGLGPSHLLRKMVLFISCAWQLQGTPSSKIS